MDPIFLSSFLIPCLPFLVKTLGGKTFEKAASKLAGKAVEGIGQKVGEDVWNVAKQVWNKLQPSIEADSAAKVAIEKLSLDPNNQTWTMALQEELAAILSNDPGLEAELIHLLEKTNKDLGSHTHIEQTIHSNQGQVVGQMTHSEAKQISRIDHLEGNLDF